MNTKVSLDHPGTERPPHDYPFPHVHNRLEDAHYLWHQAQASYFSPPRFRTHLNALIQSLRTITWLIHKSKARIPDFDQWYVGWEEKMRSDDILRWLRDARNRIEKQGDLEKYSILRASLVVKHTGEVHHDFLDNPSLKTKDVLKKINFAAVPKELIDEGFLRLERRWVAADLPKIEILDALAHAYGFLSDLVDDAHAQVGLPVPFLVTPKPDGSFVPFRGATVYFQGRLPCMVATAGDRELWVELKSGGIVRFITKQNKLTKSSIKRIKRRYDAGLLEPEDPLRTLADRIKHLWQIARHMFERDGYHVHVVFLLNDGNLLDIRGMDAPTHGSLFPLYRDLAHHVARTGATEVIVINEVWTAPFDPAQPFRRAELSPERGEGLLLSAVSAGGSEIELFAPITRRKGRAELVHRSRQKIHPSLAAHATLPWFRRCQGIEGVNLLNASVH